MDEKKVEMTEDALKGLNDFHDRILKTRIAELILESEIMAIVNAKEVIAEQKAEIERLTEENAILKGNPPLVVGRSSGKTIRAKLLAFDRMKEQNAELQNQVDELKEENVQLSEMADYDKGHKEGYEHGAKTTAKEILQKIMNIIKKSNGFLAEEVIRIMAKQKGVEVE